MSKSTSETFQLDQIQIVSAITKEVCRQFKKAGKGSPSALPIFRMQSIVEAANTVVAAWLREETKATPGMGLEAWLKCDDRGASSNAMCFAIFGKPDDARYYDRKSHPHDPDDFGRCHRFLQACPDAFGKLTLVRGLSPVWSKLVDHWDELTALYVEELPTGSAPKLYARMKELGC